MHRIARNDQRALNALFEEARPLVFSIALRILGFLPMPTRLRRCLYAHLAIRVFI